MNYDRWKKNVRGNETLLHGDELRDETDKRGGFNGGKGNARGGIVETGHVHVGAEEPDLSFAVSIGFHALEAFQAVVEHTGCWVEAEVLIGSDAGGEPALGSCPFD